jgi:hypoxanthine phosphoribosyltransferase
MGLRKIIDAAEIDRAVRRIARQVNRDYRRETPVLVGVLKGSFMFLADLVRRLTIPVEIDFARVASYGPKTEPAAEILLTKDVELPLEGRHVLIVEDITDTGFTLRFLLDHLKSKGVASVKTCVLLDKPSRRKVIVPLDYVGFSVPDAFVVGYGIDWNEQHRQRPSVYRIT